MLELPEVCGSHYLLHVDGLHGRLLYRFIIVVVLHQASVFDHDKESMILEEIDVATGEILIVIDLFVKHLS